jgi:hypothetical protein
MKKLGFALVGAAMLALAACGSDDADTLNETMDNTQADELNALANNAAVDAEVEALGTQQQQLEQESAAAENTANETDENSTDPAEVEDDVRGM